MILLNSKGFSYIEILICVIILLVIIAPVFSGFSQASRTLNYAVNNYEANLLLGNLLLDIEKVIKNHNKFENIFLIEPDEDVNNNQIYDLEDLLENLNLKDEYKLDKYNYSVTIENINGGTYNQIIQFSTGFEFEENLTKLSANNGYLFNNFNYLDFYDFVILIDDGFNVHKGNITHMDEHNLTVDLLSLNNVAVFINVNVRKINSIKNINIIADDKVILLDIKLDDEDYKEFININWDTTTNIMLSNYYMENELLFDYLATVRIYDENLNVINVISKLI